LFITHKEKYINIIVKQLMKYDKILPLSILNQLK